MNNCMNVSYSLVITTYSFVQDGLKLVAVPFLKRIIKKMFMIIDPNMISSRKAMLRPVPSPIAKLLPFDTNSVLVVTESVPGNVDDVVISDSVDTNSVLVVMHLELIKSSGVL